MPTFPHDNEITRLILDSLPMGVLFCDRGGIIRFVNKAYSDILGLATHELIGHDITEAIPHSRAQVVMREGRPEMGELCQLGPSSSQPLVVNRIPVRDSSGQVAGMVSQALFTDPQELQRLSAKIERLDRKISHYKRRIQASLAPQYSLGSILGESAIMRRLKRQVQSYARLDEPVLILGATGAGKELFAHALHAEGPRSDGPFVCINCAAIPKDLFESELFGYARGAFSGAREDGKIGQIELADKGTLFLDEIGEMPPEIQAKLLRVLESRSVCRVGSITAHNVDFRLVAATNRQMAAMLHAGSFREDLYYRINTFVLEIPPLCERTEDIPILARHTLARMGLEEVCFSSRAEEAMLAFSWPGNVRQLHNAVVHAATMRQGEVIELEDFPPETLPGMTTQGGSQALEMRGISLSCGVVDKGAAFQDGGRLGVDNELQVLMAEAESIAIQQALDAHGGNVAATARTLGIARATLYAKLARYGVRPRRKGFVLPKSV